VPETVTLGGGGTSAVGVHIAAIFDLDGVLVDTARHHFRAWRRLATEHGIRLDDSVGEALKGVGRGEALEIVLRSGGVTLSPHDAALAAGRKNQYYREYIQDLDASDLTAGAAETLRSLRERGVAVALASGTKNPSFVLGRTGIADAFDVIVDGTVITTPKPEPAVFLEAARRLGVESGDAAVIEDAPAGVEGARRAGCTTIGIGDPAVLAAADLVAPDLPAVPWDELFGKDT
jgi:beta-phosphoglucomutase